ncbi:hypothetical protein ACFSRY_15220 [Pontibacter locisalis]|uniref:PRA1 family protein n=1 Tax=Pontibacter locisalis TaxID=1719035 RepID=A0ABW5IQJ8_9BACT
MWSTNTIWFEIAIVSIVFLCGHIFLGHFEERSPKWRKLLKYLISVTLIVTISIVFGRVYALVILGLSFIPVFYIHAVHLPRKGINGWTGEPKSKYYEYRKWDKDIFNNSGFEAGKKSTNL